MTLAEYPYDSPLMKDRPHSAVEPKAASVTAPLNYLVDHGSRPATYIPSAGEGEVRRTGHYAPYSVEIRDIRPRAGDLSLDRQGFALLQHKSAFTDFENADGIRRHYYRETERLVGQAMGAARVIAFDHNLRVDGGPNNDTAGLRAPVRSVHNDYTEASGPQRVYDLMGDEAEALLRRRFAIVNLWRPIGAAVETAPLALADARSIAARELKELDLIYEDRRGEIYNAVHSPAHRWYYVSRMTPDEAIVIKGYDSQNDGRARFTLHTAFDDPTSPPDARPRQSIEVRTLAFFDW